MTTNPYITIHSDYTSIPVGTAIGSVCFNQNTNEVYVMTSDGWEQPGVINCSYIEIDNPCGELVLSDDHNRYRNYFSNILNEIERFRKAKRFGYMIILPDIGENYEYSKSRYFDWCCRYNIPYMCCEYIFGKYNIILNLNPKRNFKIRRFNNNSKDIISELFSGYQILAYKSYYKINEISIYNIEYKLDKLVELYRDSNNLETEY
jgi:hypothetical protein